MSGAITSHCLEFSYIANYLMVPPPYWRPVRLSSIMGPDAREGCVNIYFFGWLGWWDDGYAIPVFIKDGKPFQISFDFFGDFNLGLGGGGGGGP